MPTTLTLIELYRRFKGLSIRELAESTGYVANAVSQIEHGHRRPWPAIRNKISIALGVSEEVLFNQNGWAREVEIKILVKAAVGE